MTQFFPGLEPIISRYDGLLLDLWGVLHDGSALYTGARDCLERLRAAGKRIVLLSNAPRRVPKVVGVLEQLGVGAHLYDGVLSSGEAGFLALQADGGWRMADGKCLTLSSDIRHPTSYFYIGPGRDADVLDGLNLKPTPRIEEADFLLNVGFGTEAQSDDEYDAVLRRARSLSLPMICLNPDMEVVKISGERYPCAGEIAGQYERMGGHVTYFGKPYPQVYARSLAMLACEKSRVLAVGDSLHTDISGANAAGIASALVTGGILKQQLPDLGEEAVREFLAGQHARPDYVLPGLRW